MIRHIVLLRFGADFPAMQKQALFDALAALKDRIDGALAFHAGPNVSVEPHVMHGFTDLFWFDFAGEAARDAYLDDTEHQAVGARLVAAVEGGLSGILVADVRL